MQNNLSSKVNDNIDVEAKSFRRKLINSITANNVRGLTDEINNNYDFLERFRNKYLKENNYNNDFYFGYLTALTSLGEELIEKENLYDIEKEEVFTDFLKIANFLFENGSSNDKKIKSKLNINQDVLDNVYKTIERYEVITREEILKETFYHLTVRGREVLKRTLDKKL